MLFRPKWIELYVLDRAHRYLYSNPITSRKGEKAMLGKAKRTLIALTVIGSLLAAFAANAYATNGHQDHEGACARSTESISKGVGDLKFNGVLQEDANAVGIHGFNGSLTKQMEEKLVVGVAVHATTMNNNGCDGAGGTFGAGTRVIEKGEHVVVRVPPKYGKEVCSHPSSNCKKVRIVVSTGFPVSCWNKNTGRLEVYIWVHTPHHPPKHHHHKCGCHKNKPKPPPPGGSCNGNNVNNGNGSAGNCNICVGVSVCNHNPPPPPPCTVNPKECEPVDHPPQITCVWPPHVYENGGHQSIWCEASDPDGDTLTVTINGDSHAEVSSVIKVDTVQGGAPCPSGVSCYRGTLWGKEAGITHLIAEVKANGKFDKDEHNINVEEYNYES
jgi:hypothetical protein